MVMSRLLIVFGLVVAFFSTSCFATDGPREQKKLPLYEYGVVGFSARLPHYRGSDEYENYLFPLPYFVYRGERVKASRDGVRGIFWRNKRFETDISLSGNPPVSSDNEAREGMDELDGIIEIGPALRYYFYEYGERDAFFLQANLRAAFSIGFDSGLDVHYQGYVSDFSLVYRDASLFEEQRIRFHLNTGPQFGDREFHSFFYGVDQGDATEERKFYRAKGGYGGYQLSGSILKELTDTFWFGFYGRWINSTGAVYDDSPLFRRDNNYVVGALLVWKLGESERLEK